MNQHLDVRRQAAESVAEPAQFLLQLEVVVDLAVGDDVDGAGLVGDRLLAGGDVDDGEPPHPQGHARQMHHALAVGAAVRERPHHAGEVRFRDRRLQIPVDDANDPTHTRSGWRLAASG